ncbi:MAG: PUR family DNA/RNA-binding protein [Bacteroidia bacterium]|nr:PUR family DNA/RNA-binding protein [Bacteroidia bacterium]
MEFNDQADREEIYSKPVRAGKRTYFFDVKSTKGEDLYLTITESKKRFRDDGTFFYEKHKIFLYKEDFDKFSEGLNEAVRFILNNNTSQSNNTNVAPSTVSDASTAIDEQKGDNTWSDINFEDLGNDKP